MLNMDLFQMIEIAINLSILDFKLKYSAAVSVETEL